MCPAHAMVTLHGRARVYVCVCVRVCACVCLSVCECVPVLITLQHALFTTTSLHPKTPTAASTTQRLTAKCVDSAETRGDYSSISRNRHPNIPSTELVYIVCSV